ncbi:MAG: flavodoxin [Clostridia bacterium]
MSKIAVVYWSGTGNTQAMADSVAAGVKAKGAEVEMFTCDEFTSDMVANYDGIAFGCPSMGDEVLEESEFQPMWDGVAESLTGKKVALFGSYGWGDGEWMRNWEEECQNSNVVGTFICNDSPDDDAQNECEELGAKLV